MNALTTLLTMATASQAFLIPQTDNPILNFRQTSTDCSATTCTPASGGAHIIVSRASTEAAGTGVLGLVADAVVSACPSSDVAANPCKLPRMNPTHSIR